MRFLSVATVAITGKTAIIFVHVGSYGRFRVGRSTKNVGQYIRALLYSFVRARGKKETERAWAIISIFKKREREGLGYHKFF